MHGCPFIRYLKWSIGEGLSILPRTKPSFTFFLQPLPAKGLLVETDLVVLRLAPGAVVLHDALLPLVFYLPLALSLGVRCVPGEAKALLLLNLFNIRTSFAFLLKHCSGCQLCICRHKFVWQCGSAPLLRQEQPRIHTSIDLILHLLVVKPCNIPAVRSEVCLSCGLQSYF